MYLESALLKVRILENPHTQTTKSLYNVAAYFAWFLCLSVLLGLKVASVD